MNYTTQAYLRRVQVVKADDIDVAGQGLQVEACTEQGSSLNLWHCDVGHVMIKVLLSVQSEAFARARAASSPCPLNCLYPAPPAHQILQLGLKHHQHVLPN